MTEGNYVTYVASQAFSAAFTAFTSAAEAKKEESAPTPAAEAKKEDSHERVLA